MVKTSCTLCVIKHKLSTFFIPRAKSQKEFVLFRLFPSDPPVDPPIAPNLHDLPAEIISKILHDLVSPAYTHAFAFVYNCPKFVPVPDVTRLLQAQSILDTAVRVSRSWYFVGTELLYARPFLLTTQSIRSFERTITSKADLAKFVKILVVQDEDRLQANIIPILRACSSLETMTIALSKRLYTYPLDKIFTAHPPPIGAHLRKLTMTGANPDCRFTMSASMSLPNLEVLCVRGVFTSPFVTYAHLPRMHTLQVVQICKWLQGIRGAIPPLSAFPALRTIEFFQNTYSGVELTQDLLAFLPQLDRIHLIGANFELSLFRLWALSSRLDSIKYLVVGIMTSTPRFITTWRFPKRLEVLTLVVQLDPFYLSTKDEVEVVLENIYRCLEHNAEFLKEGSFRKLIIMTRTRSLGNIPQAEHASLLVELIRDFCRTHDVEFAFDQMGVEAWVTKRLVSLPSLSVGP